MCCFVCVTLPLTLTPTHELRKHDITIARLRLHVVNRTLPRDLAISYKPGNPFARTFSDRTKFINDEKTRFANFLNSMVETRLTFAIEESKKFAASQTQFTSEALHQQLVDIIQPTSTDMGRQKLVGLMHRKICDSINTLRAHWLMRFQDLDIRYREFAKRGTNQPPLSTQTTQTQTDTQPESQPETQPQLQRQQQPQRQPQRQQQQQQQQHQQQQQQQPRTKRDASISDATTALQFDAIITEKITTQVNALAAKLDANHRRSEKHLLSLLHNWIGTTKGAESVPCKGRPQRPLPSERSTPTHPIPARQQDHQVRTQHREPLNFKKAVLSSQHPINTTFDRHSDGGWIYVPYCSERNRVPPQAVRPNVPQRSSVSNQGNGPRRGRIRKN